MRAATPDSWFPRTSAAQTHWHLSCFANASPRVRRVFPDHAGVDREYYSRTDIHPIMHCVVVHRDVFENHPQAAAAIYEAPRKAQRETIASLRDTGACSAMIPFLPAVMGGDLKSFGDDYWLYGVERNRTDLEHFALQLHQQGLTPRLLAIDELFDESILGRQQRCCLLVSVDDME